MNEAKYLISVTCLNSPNLGINQDRKDKVMNKTYKITVSGRVQGVGFRNFVFKLAKQFDACGTVKNLEDGSVEISLSISEQSIKNFIEHLKKGNGFSEVVCIKISENTYIDFESFRVDYSN